jgi:hypothetical protein
MKLILQIASGVSLGILVGGIALKLVTNIPFTLQTNAVSQPVPAQSPIVPTVSAAVVQQPNLQLPPVDPRILQPTLAQQLAAYEETLKKVASSPNLMPNTDALLPANIRQIPDPSATPDNGKTAADIQREQLEFEAHQEKLKKDAAFKNWYKKPKECEAPNDYGHATLVKCGNESRARIKFEELWQQGKISL